MCGSWWWQTSGVIAIIAEVRGLILWAWNVLWVLSILILEPSQKCHETDGLVTSILQIRGLGRRGVN